jgi:ATP-dependent DNA helicase PIF1
MDQSDQDSFEEMANQLPLDLSLQTAQYKERFFAEQARTAAANSQWFPRSRNSTPQQTLPPTGFRAGTNLDADRAGQWKKDIQVSRTDRIATMNEVRRVVDDAADAAVRFSFKGANVENIPKIYLQGPTKAYKQLADEISEFFSLDEDQRLAFDIITKHAETTRSGAEATPTLNDQLRMYVGGAAGTGKSQVINASVMFFETRGIRHTLRLAAPTGSAASLIDGSTIDSLICEGWDKKADKNIRMSASDALERQWKGVKYLFIDEVSMIGQTKLATIHKRIAHAKRTNGEEMFAGVNLVYFGDFHQHRPVLDTALFMPQSTPTDTEQKFSSGEKNLTNFGGRQLWRSLNAVVLLEKQKRYKNDERFLNLLTRLRFGRCTGIEDGPDNDYSFLLSKLATLKNPLPIPTDREYPPVIVTRNLTRTFLNEVAVTSSAQHAKTDLVTWYAEDNYKGISIKSINAKGEALQNDLHKLPDNKTERLPGRMWFRRGMKVMLTTNVAAEIGLCNGMEGVMEDLVTDPSDVPERQPDGSWLLSRVPQYILVKINPHRPVNFPGLPENIVPVNVVSRSFQYPPGVTKAQKANGRRCWSINRRQVSLIPKYSITDFKSQGMSMDQAVIDLQTPPKATSKKENEEIGGSPSPYVMLSRLRSSDGLTLLRPFPQSILQQGLHPALRDEIDFLNDLATATKEHRNPIVWKGRTEKRKVPPSPVEPLRKKTKTELQHEIMKERMRDEEEKVNQEQRSDLFAHRSYRIDGYSCHLDTFLESVWATRTYLAPHILACPKPSSTSVTDVLRFIDSADVEHRDGTDLLLLLIWHRTETGNADGQLRNAFRDKICSLPGFQDAAYGNTSTLQKWLDATPRLCEMTYDVTHGCNLHGAFIVPRKQNTCVVRVAIKESLQKAFDRCFDAYFDSKYSACAHDTGDELGTDGLPHSTSCPERATHTCSNISLPQLLWVGFTGAKIDLDDHVIIRGITYRLMSVARFRPPRPALRTVGHFVCYCNPDDDGRWWFYDDLAGAGQMHPTANHRLPSPTDMKHTPAYALFVKIN